MKLADKYDAPQAAQITLSHLTAYVVDEAPMVLAMVIIDRNGPVARVAL